MTLISEGADCDSDSSEMDNPRERAAWYNGTGRFHPGIVPYGPWVKQKEEGQGPWDHDWANKSAYPAIAQWPGAERWFANRCSPLNSEFTIHQTIAPSAAMYGILCATPEELAALIPGCRLVRLPGVGRLVPEEVPDTVVSLLLEFIGAAAIHS